MKYFIAGLVAGIALATSTMALAGARSSSTPATPGERLIAQKLDRTNRLLLLNFTKLIDLDGIESKTAAIESNTAAIKSNTEKACAYLRTLTLRTSTVSAFCS